MGPFGESSLAFNFDGHVKCVSLNNWPWESGPTLIDTNFYDTSFYPFTVNVNKSGVSCNSINDLYAWICVPNKVKNINVKVFNLVLDVNELTFLVQRESCECECRLNECLCNPKHKFWCQCKKLDDWHSRKYDYMWSHSTCDFECNKVYKIEEYLDVKNCPCKKCLFGKLVLACEYEILNTTETLLADIKVTGEKQLDYLIAHYMIDIITCHFC